MRLLSSLLQMKKRPDLYFPSTSKGVACSEEQVEAFMRNSLVLANVEKLTKHGMVRHAMARPAVWLGRGGGEAIKWESSLIYLCRHTTYPIW